MRNAPRLRKKLVRPLWSFEGIASVSFAFFCVVMEILNDLDTIRTRQNMFWNLQSARSI